MFRSIYLRVVLIFNLDSKLNEKDDIRNNNNNESRNALMDVEQGPGKLPLPPPPPPMLSRPISNDERGNH